MEPLVSMTRIALRSRLGACLTVAAYSRPSTFTTRLSGSTWTSDWLRRVRTPESVDELALVVPLTSLSPTVTGSAAHATLAATTGPATRPSATATRPAPRIRERLTGPLARTATTAGRHPGP